MASICVVDDKEIIRESVSAALTRDDHSVTTFADPVDALREADHLVSAITQNLRRAIDTDEEDARLLRARKQTVARALNTSHSTERAMVAYRTERARVSRIDQLDETP